MKYPKLRQTFLCQFLLYLPGMLWLLPLLVLLLLSLFGKDDLLNKGGGWMLVAGMLIGGVISVWYLLRFSFFLIGADGFFSAIRRWKKDRAEYRLPGRAVGKYPETLRRRLGLWGIELLEERGGCTLFFRQPISWTVFWSAIDEKAVLCRTDILTEESFRILTAQARTLLPAISPAKPRLKTKKERKAPRLEAAVILLLADEVEESVKRLARKPLLHTEGNCIVPCVIQLRDGLVYTDCTCDPHEPGMTPRPAKNHAAAMIRWLVFGGRLPKENRETQPAPDFKFDAEMSLWDCCSLLRRESHNSPERERHKALHRMQEGEITIRDGIVRYKHVDRIAEFTFLPEEEDSKVISLVSDGKWFYEKKKDPALRFFVPDCPLNTRAMKQRDRTEARKKVEERLIEEGYSFAQDSE